MLLCRFLLGCSLRLFRSCFLLLCFCIWRLLCSFLFLGWMLVLFLLCCWLCWYRFCFLFWMLLLRLLLGCCCGLLVLFCMWNWFLSMLLRRFQLGVSHRLLLICLLYFWFCMCLLLCSFLLWGLVRVLLFRCCLLCLCRFFHWIWMWFLCLEVFYCCGLVIKLCMGNLCFRMLLCCLRLWMRLLVLLFCWFRFGFCIVLLLCSFLCLSLFFVLLYR